MKVYISGISGTGMGPLALVAKNAGIDVCGSDLSKGAIYDELVKAGIDVYIGEQDGKFLNEHLDELDWFVYTSALSEDNPELVQAREAGVKCTKRDDFTAYLVDKLGLKMVAVAGTHGKTTTTSMIVWACLRLGLPAAYVVGTTLGFASSGAYREGDKYFVYEADEYDRNFLKYHPWLAAITTVSYDHPDIYKDVEEYAAAFRQFEGQSEIVVRGEDAFGAEEFELAGEARRRDAALACEVVMRMAPGMDRTEVVRVLNDFPGVGRRFEKIADGVYTDYAHHPEEIAATLKVARDQVVRDRLRGVVVVYQPHQNVRQYEVRDGYQYAFVGADKIYWLPTYLTREDPALAVLTPEELAENVSVGAIISFAEVGNELAEKLKEFHSKGYMILLMTAGPADAWYRNIDWGEAKDF